MADKIREAGALSAVEQDASASMGARAPKPQTHRAQQKAITQGLRKFFDTVASEPVPDEFLALLQKIDGKKESDA
jgi:hypothetical protein